MGVGDIWAQPGIIDETNKLENVLEWKRRPAIHVDMQLHFRSFPVRDRILATQDAGTMSFWEYVELTSNQHYWWRDRIEGPGRALSVPALGRIGEWVDGTGPPDVARGVGNVRHAFATDEWNEQVRIEFDAVTSTRARVELSKCVQRAWRRVAASESLRKTLEAVVMATPDIADDFVIGMAMQRLESKTADSERLPPGDWDFYRFKDAFERVVLESIALRASDYAVDFERSRLAEIARRKREQRLRREEKERIKAEKKARREERRRKKAAKAKAKHDEEEKERARVTARLKKIQSRKF